MGFIRDLMGLPHGGYEEEDTITELFILIFVGIPLLLAMGAWRALKMMLI